MRLSQLVSGLDIRPPSPAAPPAGDPVITNITEDSRAVTPGCLFVARQGDKADGRTFIPDALAAGAAAILIQSPAPTPDHTGVPVLTSPDLPRAIANVADRFFGHPSRSLRLLGVTGTNGKTTTTFLMQQMLAGLGITCGLVGTVRIDDGSGPVPATMTTPSAIDLARTLAAMVKNGCRACAIEVSSHALHQHRVGALTFAAAAFTNLTGDHLDYHGTMDRYADAKAMLFDMLPPGAPAIVNAADPWHTRMLRDSRGTPFPVRLLTDAAPPPANETTARITSAGPAWLDLALAGPLLPGTSGGASAHFTARVPLVGDFNAVNALQALAMLAAVFGPAGTGEIPIADLLRALASVQAPPGRLEPVRLAAPSDQTPVPSVLVDYAHTDDALRNVLTTVRAAMARHAAPGARLWCVFGCGGDRDRTKRPRMGRLAAELADRVVITSDNPRTERPEAILDEILTGVPTPRTHIHVDPDRARAIHTAIAEAAPADVIVIAGKGHEDYQITADPDRPGRTIKRHFDDREVARDALAALAARTRATSEPSPAVVPAGRSAAEPIRPAGRS